MTGPSFRKEIVNVKAFDLTRQGKGEPLGERIVVSGQVRDEDGRSVRGSLVEIWQANSAGRYLHKIGQHDAPLDRTSGCWPNFHGRQRPLPVSSRFVRVHTRGKMILTRGGRSTFTFRCSGQRFATRLVTQMYFPGDPLLEFDPIFNSVAR